MRWKGRRQSENIEDRRGISGGAVVGGGIGLLVIAMIVGLLGGDPRQFMQQAQQGQVAVGQGGGQAELSARDIERGEFVSTVLADTEDVWNKIFAESGLKYEEPKMELFKQQTQSGCGVASSAAGPFYCPADRKVYLDTAFFDQLDQQLGAPGDFAQAYVVAHEVGGLEHDHVHGPHDYRGERRTSSLASCSLVGACSHRLARRRCSAVGSPATIQRRRIQSCAPV